MHSSMLQTLLKNETEAADRVYLRQPRKGVWHHYTWSEVMLQARKVAAYLQALGLKKGSNVAIISKNCAEWFITDFGITLAGMVSVPLFANQHIESIHFVLEQADVQLVFVGKLDDHRRMREAIPQQYQTIGFDYHRDLKVDHRWSDVMDIQPLINPVEPAPDDLYTIIYSSGTSGLPKGAMYTHQTIAQYLELFPKDLRRIRDLDHYKLISYLPLAHVYERSAIELSSLVIPCEVAFIESLDKFTQTLQEVQPTFFTAVPRIWGVFQQRIEQRISSGTLDFLLKIPLISKFIKRKITKNLGLLGSMNYFSGASFLPSSINDFFNKLDIPIQDGYGQTENLAYATVSLLEDKRSGYVGAPRLGVSIRLGEDNELLIHSPCLMSGYYKDLEASKRAFTADGWLRTGDVVEIDSRDRVKILGRLSENFKNQSGEFVAPGPIEKLFAANPIIDQLCLVGRGLMSNVLLVVLNKTAMITMKKDQLERALKDQLHEVNSKLLKHEKISHIVVVKSAWIIENDLLTPTLKIKRRMVEEHYASLIQDSLKQRQLVVWE